jgi:DNA-directed RNA polymerase subunit beta'
MQNQNAEQNWEFSNEVVNKKKLQNLMSLAFHNYGIVKSSIIADRLKNLTFHYATKSGISLSIEDLRVPLKKRHLIGLTNDEVLTTEQKYEIGHITSVERFQKIIDIWNNASNFLKDEVLTYFRESDPLNPLYIMAFSGARGNISQVRQLVGMRGLMADPQGQIIDLPIKSNFREGLKVTEYIISSYGARKGLVDTALRTADSGYLTRRLVDVAQDIIVREEDCKTKESLSKVDLEKYATTLSLKDRIVGRLIAELLVIKKEKFPPNSEITLSLVQKMEQSDLENFKIRSPLTCNSIRSVCRNCYGWHLSYSSIVDLGEAVGIIAAQSIGEPGTQLTMRTFHTGGVFSGDLTRQIRAPFSGTIFYKTNSDSLLVRTIHGEKGFQLREKLYLTIENLKGTVISLLIPNETTLLVNNGQKIYANQIIAEIKKEANLLLEEDKKEIYTEVSGEAFFPNLEAEKIIDKQGTAITVSKKSGLIWVLFGERYSLPRFTTLKTRLGESISPNHIVANRKIVNNYSGIISFDKINQDIRIKNFSFTLRNSLLKSTIIKNQTIWILNTDNGKKLQLQVEPNKALHHGQTIAVLLDNSYKTKTGGILTYDLENITNKKRRTRKIFSGLLYWIPEETHKIDNSINFETLNIRNGFLIKEGTEIVPNVFSKTSGLVEIDQTNNEIIIKPCELFSIRQKFKKSVDKINRFIKPGEEILPGILAQRLTYIEFTSFNDVEYVAARPVQIYKVPKGKDFSLTYSFFPNSRKNNVAFKTVKRIFFKNWERVKSVSGVNLLQTFLVLDIRNTPTNLQPKLEFETIDNSEGSKRLKLSFYEIIKNENIDTKNSNTKIQSTIHYLIKENQYVMANTILAQIQISFNIIGTLVAANKSEGNTQEILVLKEKDIKKVSYCPSNDKTIVKPGALIRVGTPLTKNIKSSCSGQVYAIDNNYISIRLGRPYMISEGTILRVNSGTLVQRSDVLATLVYDKLKTVDIVQGLPKVEEILEARKIKNSCLLAPHEGHAYLRYSKIEVVDLKGKKTFINIGQKIKTRFNNGDFINLVEPLTDGAISPHEKLELLFSYYKEKLPIAEACKKSFKHLQLFLVSEVQRTYLSQGVQIADKHIEIIVKQMTSKVQVEDSGDTTLLPGELLSLNQAEIISNAALVSGQTPLSYIPILLGLTKASLNSDSFISAASFQETTRVLTEAAIEGKKDWLNGLKENVIIGRLIPAGTGFNSYINLKYGKWRNENIDLILNNSNQQTKLNVLNLRLNN